MTYASESPKDILTAKDSISKSQMTRHRSGSSQHDNLSCCWDRGQRVKDKREITCSMVHKPHDDAVTAAAI